MIMMMMMMTAIMMLVVVVMVLMIMIIISKGIVRGLLGCLVFLCETFYFLNDQ